MSDDELLARLDEVSNFLYQEGYYKLSQVVDDAITRLRLVCREKLGTSDTASPPPPTSE